MIDLQQTIEFLEKGIDGKVEALGAVIASVTRLMLRLWLTFITYHLDLDKAQP